MLNQLTSEVLVLVCTEVDETASTRTWNKKADKQLEKLNNDCNMTAGLEAKLSLAVGARVMLRHNIDTKTGLVNSAIGTVCAISQPCDCSVSSHQWALPRRKGQEYIYGYERIHLWLWKVSTSTEDSFH